ncbi:MAG: NAD-dependent epimerase/dehydratase family protein [Polyangiaceae bacterium]
MSASLTVLVTGATGHLGTAVCEALIAAGHRVKATDRKYVKDFPIKPILGDLLDEHFVYGVVEGCDAVVHLGNHPNLFSGPSPQQTPFGQRAYERKRVLGRNAYRCSKLVFASSVQVMLRSNGGKREAPFRLPYLPLDGNAPTDPGTNTYALSKEVGERALQVLCEIIPIFAQRRFVSPCFHAHLGWRISRQSKITLPGWLNIGECMTHLMTPDAGVLVAKCLDRPKPGYRQYFPALAMRLRGHTTQDLYREHYSHVPLRCPLEELTELVDLPALKRDFDFEPSDRIEIDVQTPT